jgi:putative hemolysin
MRPVAVAALLAAAAASGLAGCAKPQPTGAGGPTGSTPTPPGAVTCAGPSQASATLTEANAGATICLKAGGRLEIYLHSTPDRLWAPISLDGTALSRAASGKGTLALGVTGGFFTAGTPGSTVLVSHRTPCGTPAPAGADCGASNDFRVTITVA